MNMDDDATRMPGDAEGSRRGEDLDNMPTFRGLAPGERVFGRFTLERILGRGGMAVVWLARDEDLGRRVALKFLSEITAHDAVAVRDLRRETRKSLELTHPHIVRVYDFFQAGDLAAISMEYVEGKTLSELRLEQPEEVFTPEVLLPWLSQLCAALDYAHGQAGVVHRDLKPSNLMIDAKGNLKITDFGISASLSDSRSRVSNVGSSGTPAYMSPQQLLGQTPTAADDLYALGVTLYELLTGKPPFHSGDLTLQIREVVPPPMSERLAQLEVPGAAIPESWENAVAACLAKESEDRPASAEEVLGMMKDEGRMKKAPSRKAKRGAGVPPARAGRSAPSGFKPVWLVAAFLLLTTLGAAGWWLGVHQPEQRRQAEAVAQEAFHSLRERIDGFSERSPLNALADFEREVEAYLLSAPETYRELIRERWRGKRSAVERYWETARGGLVLDTIPTGAEVRIGGLSMETSPVRLSDLRLGDYNIEIRHPGYEVWMGSATVEDGRHADLGLISLERSLGSLRIEVEPADAEWELTKVDGEIVPRRGRGSARETNLPTGAYQLRTSAAGMRTAEVAATVQRQQTGTTRIALEKQRGSLEIQLENPELRSGTGVSVKVDGRSVSGTFRDGKLTLQNLEPGRRSLEVSHRSYRSHTSQPTVSDQRTTVHRVKLEPLPGQLTLQVSGPPAGQWTLEVNGRAATIGAGNTLTLAAQQEHRLRITATGWHPWEQAVTLGAAENRRIEAKIRPIPAGADRTAERWEVVNERWVRNFYSNGHITMNDRQTGLMWVYDAGAHGQANWHAAQARCQQLSYAGYSDWYLPNRDQLRAMYSQKSVFKNLQPSRYWSSTFHNVFFAWRVDMANGGGDINRDRNSYWVWPCRKQN
jgi:hypothetical protein